jgi:hypothetical protein
VVIAESDAPARWWPWSITSYNHWPYWMGGSDSYGGDSGHRPRPPHSPRPPRSEGDQSRPWGGAQRGANGGGFHAQSSSTPST